MSMLAEKKRKQKWLLNPRGKDWSQDANKFGQKMLEKMGWQQGKGLGPKGDGMVEHIKVAYKNDSKGMGYKESNDQWTQHETNFCALLESLSGKLEKPDEVKVNSLEKKSQSSRARVHYHKFTRGKDLSRYSEKDLANIFGKKSLNTEIKVEKTEIANEEESSKDTGSSFLFNAGSMRDYFKSKMPKFAKQNDYVIGNDGVLKKNESDSESEMRPSFGFGFKTDSENSSGPTFVSYVSNASIKRKADELSDNNIFSPKKKSKKGKENKSCLALGLINPGFDNLSKPTEDSKHVLEPINESFSEEISISIENNVITTEVDVHRENSLLSTNVSELSHKKKKKSKQGSFSIESSKDISRNQDSLDSVVEESFENDISCNREIKSSKKQKKHKKLKDETAQSKCGMEFENPNFEDVPIDSVSNSTLEENPFEVKPKQKKKKNKKNEFDNPSFEITDGTSMGICQVVENPYEVKLTKKRKLIYENPLFTDNGDDSIGEKELQIEENPYEVKNTKKRKKVYENSTFIENDDNSASLVSEDNPYEVKPKNKKKKRKLTSNHSDLNSSAETSTENPSDTQITKEKKKKKKKIFEEEELSSTENSCNIELNNKKNVKSNGITNPALNISDTSESTIVEDCDLMLNVVATPIEVKTPISNTNSSKKLTLLKRRKSVRFSDVTQEHIIPNNDDLRRMSSVDFIEEGIDNVCFDKQKTEIDEQIETLSKDIESCQAEIENDINENKIKSVKMEDLMVGEVGNPHGDDELLPDGDTKLKFKNANFSAHTPFYHTDKVGPKKSYKHLIKGDIIVKFKNSNLHEIEGYATKKKKNSVR